MILKKINSDEKILFKRALKKVSDSDVLDFLEQKTAFDGSGNFEIDCHNKLLALLYDYEKQVTDYEDLVNTLSEKIQELSK